MKPAHELKMRWAKLQGERRGHEATWQDILDHGMPFRGDITTVKSEGDARMVGVYDTTFMQAGNDLANFLKSSAFPTSTDWLRFEPAGAFDGSEMELRQVLDITAARIMEALFESNFYVEIGSAIRDLVFLGNQCLSVREDRMRLRRDGSTFGGLVFKSHVMDRIWWKFGVNGRPIMVFREFDMPAIDAARFFENKPGRSAIDLIEEGKAMDDACYVHVVYFNEKGVPGGLRSPTERPYVSRYFATDGDRASWEEVDEGGYNTNPYVCSRWMVVDGEEYGRGPGHIARADAKSVNELRRKVLQAADYDLDPALMVEDENILDLDIGAGGTVVVKPAMQQRPDYLTSGARYDVANQIGMEDRAQIRAAMLHEALRGKDTQPRSALESRLEFDRQMRLLSGPADVVYTEMVSPMIDAVFDIMLEADALPEVKQYARANGEQSIRTIMVSPFFTAQKSAQVERVQAFLQRRIELFSATQDPSWLIDIDPSAVTRFDSTESDVPASIFRTEEEIDQIRQAEQERQAAEQLQQAAGTLRDVSQVDQMQRTA